MTVDYRIAPSLVARVLAAGLITTAVVVLALTAASSLIPNAPWWIAGAALLGVCGVAVLAWWLLRAAYVVRVDEHGYRTRFLRGVGTERARWKDVEDAVATHVAGDPCVVLRLRDGRSTTIPVTALAVDRERFVRELQERLQHGHKLRRLG